MKTSLRWNRCAAVSLFGLLFLILSFAGPEVASGNDVGGGTPGTGPDVALTDKGTSVVLTNGTLTATITKTDAKVVSLLYNGREVVSSDASAKTIYFSMDGSTSYEQPSHCVESVKTQTTDMVDLSFLHTYSASAGDIHPVDIDIHYVLRRGDSGMYVYAVLSHPAAYPDLTIGEWRMVWQLPHDSTNYVFEKEYVDDLRHHDMPTYADLTKATATSIAEIVQLTTGTRAGLFDCKYEFSANYWDLGCWGHASDANGIGAWVVMGSHEFFNDGPTKQDLTIAAPYILTHFGMDHYNASSTSAATGTAWSKIYGPYLVYCNTAATGAACWADAKAQSVAEQAAWPYSWLTANSNYPLAAGRGAVNGTFAVTDAVKAGVSGAGAWVGLAQPDGTATYDWQFDSNHYEYWAKADASGKFAIPNVRPGVYTLYAFTNGAVGQFSQANVTVAAGQTNALGTVNWTVPHVGGYILWEIGVPDRTATEFRHGSTDYYLPYLYKQFATDLPNPLTYTIGKSNWATDWNYAHSTLETGGTPTTQGTLSGWNWNINFDLASVPASGNATLTIAFAGSDHGHMYLYVNGGTNPFANFYPAVSEGNALLRESVHAKYCVSYVTIPVSKLKVGTNTITLLQASTSGTGNHFMYDYLSLEMPGVLPTPVITSATTASAQVGQAFSYQIAGTNAPARFAATGLPAGLAVDPATGLISGAPVAAGSFTVVLGASNTGGTGTATLTLAVNSGQPSAAPVITGAASATAQVGTAFAYQIAASNAPTSFGAAGLPTGLAVDTSTGLISGTPTQAGAFSVGLSADNASGTGTATLALTVAAATVPTPPAITSALTANALQGRDFNYQITASNAPTGFAATGLPDGLSINAATGLISGMPAQLGTFSVGLGATNAGGSGTGTLVLTVAPAIPVLTLVATTPVVTAGSGEQGSYLLILSEARSTDTVVNLVIKGSAVNGTDYGLLKSTKKIKAGKTSKPIKITPLGEGAGPGVKRVVSLSLAPGDGYAVGTTSKVKVKIIGQ